MVVPFLFVFFAAMPRHEGYGACHDRPYPDVGLADFFCFSARNMPEGGAQRQSRGFKLVTPAKRTSFT